MLIGLDSIGSCLIPANLNEDQYKRGVSVMAPLCIVNQNRDYNDELLFVGFGDREDGVLAHLT